MIRGKIYIQKYSWADTVPVTERNLYSDATVSISPRIEITDLLISGSLSEIEYTKEAINANDNKLYLESSNFSFNLLDATNSGLSPLTVSDYLGLYEYDNTYKFVITVEDNHDNIYIKGLLYKDGISYQDRKNNIISLLAVGFENEFKDYYQNSKLPDLSFNTLLNINLSGFKARLLKSVLQDLFNIDVEFSSSILNYYISRTPYYYKPHTDFFRQLINIRSGYECFRRDEITKMTFLNSICLSMGWVWYIYNDVLYIKNRHERNYTERVINWETEIMNHSVKNVQPDITFDNVLIDSGSFFSNGTLLSPAYSTASFQSLQGQRMSVYKSEIGYDNYIQPFYNLYLDGTTYNIGYNNYTTIYQNSDNNKHTFKKYNVYQPQPAITNEVFEYPDNRTLLLTPYVNTQDNAGGIDITLARTTGGYIDIGNGNFFSTNIALGDNDFRYTGNAGMSLFLYDSDIDKYITYDDYTNLRYSNTFKDNFAKYSKFNERIMFEVDVNGLITNPLLSFKISNYPYWSIENDTFSLQALSYDLNRNTSKLILQKDL